MTPPTTRAGEARVYTAAECRAQLAAARAAGDTDRVRHLERRLAWMVNEEESET
jgi:hypothetical protein